MAQFRKFSEKDCNHFLKWAIYTRWDQHLNSSRLPTLRKLLQNPVTALDKGQNGADEFPGDIVRVACTRVQFSDSVQTKIIDAERLYPSIAPGASRKENHPAVAELSFAVLADSYIPTQRGNDLRRDSASTEALLKSHHRAMHELGFGRKPRGVASVENTPPPVIPDCPYDEGTCSTKVWDEMSG